VWLGKELISLIPTVPRQAALPHHGSGFGPARFKPQAFADALRFAADWLSRGIPYPALICVGRKIRTAVLQVNCALGEVPRERSVEGDTTSF